MITLTDDEIGKTVVGSNGEEIGIVASVEPDTAHVEPEPGIVDRVKGVLGWESDTEDTVPISTDEIREVTDSEVHIEPHFGESAMDAPSGDAGLDDPSVASSTESETDQQEELGAHSEMEHTEESMADEESRHEDDESM
ncbi:MAG: hypothetical protein U5K37_13410 [Natrialbaceae archaeon]|nr:hypothetical protein [Natrialbaceae archaeon]